MLMRKWVSKPGGSDEDLTTVCQMEVLGECRQYYVYSMC